MDWINHEYLLTNGLGGYSFSTTSGKNARKYHSVYTASLKPPIERVHMVSQLTPYFNGKLFEGPLHRRMAFLHGTNLLAVEYTVKVNEPTTFALEPWFNFRDHHDVKEPVLEDYMMDFSDDSTFVVNHPLTKLWIKCHGLFKADRKETPETHYPIESRRGYPDREKHIVLGSFNWELNAGEHRICLMFNLQNEFINTDEVFQKFEGRKQHLLDLAGFKNENIQRLVLAADDFIVHRESTKKKTILAGYPWFTDWGRDTMISISGLTLSTGRAKEGFEMIEGFLKMLHQGIIPNNFPDEGQEPMYNTSDGTLWLFQAVYAYYQKTKDLEGIKNIFPRLVEIIEHHLWGTINEIYMDTDGLLSTGNEETQLTWMDVKVEGWVVTPRHGKAVEINALWYNALSVLKALAEEIGEREVVKKLNLESLIPKVKKAFNEQFWNAEASRLYDLVIDGEPVDIPRPNMIFAVSLSFEVLDKDKWKAVVDTVASDFKTPYGLLTLRRDDPDFHGVYAGSLLERDGAYHRGTAWGWLLGPYFTARYKVYSDLREIKRDIKAAFEHLDEGVMGSFSEIFQGDFPHAQRGCPAQAWSVAELIRVWDELKLDED